MQSDCIKSVKTYKQEMQNYFSLDMVTVTKLRKLHTAGFKIELACLILYITHA